MKTKYPRFDEIPVSGRTKACLSLLEAQNIKNKIIIDIGCSFGWLEWQVKGRAREIIGIDPSPEAIEHAKANVKNTKFYVSTADKLPVKSKFADIATMFDVIEHVPVNTEVEALKEINRVLKRGGRLLISTPNNHPVFNIFDPAWYFGHRHYKPSQIRKFLKDSGFKILSLEIKGGYWSIIYLLWFYITKRLTGNNIPRNKWLEEREERDHAKSLYTIYVVAQKEKDALPSN